MIYIITDWIMSYITCYIRCYIGITKCLSKILIPVHGLHTAICHFILIDQFKTNPSRKQINTCLSCLATNHRWNATRIPLCVCVEFPVPSLLSSLMKQWKGALGQWSYIFKFIIARIFSVLLNLEAEIFKHTRRKHTPQLTVRPNGHTLHA